MYVIGGTVIDKLNMEKHIEEYVWSAPNIDLEPEEMTRKDRINFSKSQVKDIINKVWLYILLGVGIGAAIHNWIPQSFIEKKYWELIILLQLYISYIGEVYLSMLIYLVQYYCRSFGSKGVGIGTVLSFMMAVTTLSLPSMIIKQKGNKTKIIIHICFIVTIESLIIGYTFNIFSYIFYIK